ncbi:MAG: T9SS type A sorting domain-containing protein [candidate division Zixibacteria bacterium]
MTIQKLTRTANQQPFTSALLICLCLITMTSSVQGSQPSAPMLSPNSVTLTWTAPGDDGANGTAASYDIRYSETMISASNWAACSQVASEPIPQAGGSTEVFEVPNLASSATYYFALRACDEAGNWSTISNVVAKATSDGGSPDPVTDLLAITGSAHGSIDITFTATGDDGLVGQATAYDIRFDSVLITAANFSQATPLPSPPIPASSGQDESITISSLNPGTIYYVAIKVLDEISNQSVISNVSSAEAYVDLALDIDDELDNLPITFSLGQNYPNPFNPSTTIEYSLPQLAHVSLTIYNVNGQTVKILVDDIKSRGQHLVQWNGVDQNGHQIASGMYFYRIQTGDYTSSQKMILLN